MGVKKSLILLTVLISILYYAKDANASFLLEPYTGLNISSSGKTETENFDITGYTVGGRVGFQKTGLMLGLDGRRFAFEFEPESASSYEVTGSALGFFVGYDFPSLFRVYATYLFRGEFENDESNLKFTEGSGAIFGVGYKVLPYASLNLDIMNMATTKRENRSATIDYDVDYTLYLASISLPISL